MTSPISWAADDSFEIDGVGYICDRWGLQRDTEARFCLAKIPRTVDRLAAYLADLAPKTIVEVGILEGASTALLADLVRPEKLIAIERDEAPTAKLAAFIARRRLEGTVTVYGGVDQADTMRVTEIVDRDLGGRELDLVVDDASHLFDPTLATFNALFPRLRPGGVYLLEDWSTGLKAGGPMPLEPGQRPLVDLLHEAISAKGRVPTLVGDVTVRGGWAAIERGTAAAEDAVDITIAGRSQAVR